ncbi:hypothetical protein TVAG_121600 [Trichomonas vaginalis G3]|uniref:Uncharacterized protein n=1 Tax=Trichomonas vaginalis (strain ATCC PRA-98 / G3) TaxID=412133 RepID=A2E971_TRIV3|nr:hypothetical protein TVAGG3_0421630 [Trichomonas vaginalis G3]EAY10756.1 hypothetical protein TVAG_121600 [Trichomonas vaginalis G3]KAI5536106.1 hypothetical protein TVAGG3_0421630 [Trichomonas vaginalis G3]|eukprot:XP_001322979.1 hypothetical protein [Trichomonas vaginalis G3]
MSNLPSMKNPSLGRTAYLKEATNAKDPPVSTINDLTDYISLFKSKRDKQICLNKYDKAEQTRLMMEKFSRRAQTALYTRRCQSQISDLDYRLTSTQENEEQFNQDSTNLINSFEEYAENKLNQLKSKHTKELEQHEQNKPKDLPAKYRKRSPELIQLYQLERKLSIENRMDQVAQIREEIKVREEKESKEVFNRAISEWESDKQQLLEKQRKELEAMTNRINLHRQERNDEIARQREAIHKRQKNLKYDINGIQTRMTKTTPHAMRRSLFFATTPTTRTANLVPNMNKDIYTLSSTLPKRSREILSTM